MQIKTLAEILAESDTDSASSATPKPKKESARTNDNKPYKNKFSHIDRTESGSTPKTSSNPKSSSAKTSKKKRKKRFHPAANFTAEPTDAELYKDPDSQSIRDILAEVKRDVASQQQHSEIAEKETQSDSPTSSRINLEPNTNLTSQAEDQLTATELDNLPSALKAYLRTPEQKQAETDAIKAESRLRWLAFYYLSRREHGRAELKQKLIDKEQDPDKIDALLDELSLIHI